MTHACTVDHSLDDYIALDSGASLSCTSHRGFVEDLDTAVSPVTVATADDGRMVSIGVGHVGEHIKHILLFPSLRIDLLSVLAMTRDGYKCDFGPTHSTITKDGKLVSKGTLQHNLYLHRKSDFSNHVMEKVHRTDNSPMDTSRSLHIVPLTLNPVKTESIITSVPSRITSCESKAINFNLDCTQSDRQNVEKVKQSYITSSSNGVLTPALVPSASLALTPAEEIMAYHCRAGHMGFHKILMQTKLGLVKGLGFTYEDLLKLGKIVCHICKMAKLQRLPRYLSTSMRPTPDPGTHWSVDIKPKLPRSLQGNTLCFSWIDHGSRMTLHDPGKHKDDIADSLHRVRKFVLAHQKLQPGFKSKQGILVIHSDDEVVITSGNFRAVCEELNIKCTIAAPYVHEQAGLIESAIKTDYTTARAIMIHARVKPYMWDHALRYVAQTRFMSITSKGLGEPKTPFELWNGYKPDVSHLRKFGATAYHIINKADHKSTFDLKAKVGILVGYSSNRKGCYDILATVQPYKLVQRSDVVFEERLPSPDPLRDTMFYRGEESQDAILIGAKKPGDTFVQFYSSKDEDEEEYGPQPSHANLVVDYSDGLAELIGRPQLYIHDVLRHPAKPLFLQALMEEWDAHDAAGTFEYIDESNFVMPPDVQVINLQANFRVSSVKDKPDKLKVKSRVSGRGDELPTGREVPSYSPTAPRHHLRLLLACMAQFRWKGRKLDIVTAYLAAMLQALVYFRVPRSIARPGKPRFGRIIKALYGLPESGRLFNQYLDKMLKSKGYNPLECDPCIYIKILPDGKIILAVYVDDIACFATSDEIIEIVLLPDMQALFNIKDEGDLTRMLSVDIHHNYDTDTVTLSQLPYIQHILKEFDVTHSRHNPSVIEPARESTAIVDMPTSVLRRVGSLRYLCDNTRPDLLFATGRAATDPTGQRAQHALEYLSATSNYTLQYRYSPTGLQIRGYCDASFKQRPNASSYYSTTVFINDVSGTVQARSKRVLTQVPQHVVEAEIYAACELAKDLLGIVTFLREIGVPFTTPALLYTDSSGTIANITSHQYRPLNRHMEPRIQGLRKWFTDGQLNAVHVPSIYNLADYATKVVINHDHFARSAQCNLGMISRHYHTPSTLSSDQPSNHHLLAYVDDNVNPTVDDQLSTVPSTDDEDSEDDEDDEQDEDFDDMPPLIWDWDALAQPC